ncbi:hypothetical protein [Aurantiacibacter flavus]|uniref:Uncharacterized protein n=1 Tax=Aurantiacibacter flavus TaxID=3145232 RepID=A0ABV0CWI3_9SPHN
MNIHFENLLDLATEIMSLEANEDRHKMSGEWKQAKRRYEALQEEFAAERTKFIDAVLVDDESHAHALGETQTAIQGLKERADASWIPALEYLEANLLPKLEKEAGRSPSTRKFLKALPFILGAALLIGYFGTRVATAVDLGASIDSKTGIEQRASALSKALRYDHWANTKVRRGGWLKGIMLWPIEPTEEEVAAAADFAGLALEASSLATSEYGCSPLKVGYDNGYSDEELAYLQEIANRVRSESFVWQDPPVIALLDAALKIRGC